MKTFFSLIVLVLVMSCNTSTSKLQATVEEVPDGTKVYLSQLGSQNMQVGIDTTEVQNNTFEFDLKEQGQAINLIQIEGLNGNLIFINDANQIEMDVDESNLRKTEIKAGKHNRLLKDYIDLITQFSKNADSIRNHYQTLAQGGNEEAYLDMQLDMKELEQKSKEASVEFIKTNTHSIVGMMALSDVMNSKMIPLNQMKSIYDEFDDEVKDTPLGKMIGQNIATIGATDIGAEAPKFAGPTPEGKELALEDAMGKVTLIDFWASWCKPCRIENPNIVSVYNDYKDKGFAVVGVSLDKPNSRDAWLKAIEEDQLDWNHISNLQHWQDPIARKYNIRAIPAAFLIDENGIIIGKDLRGDALRKKVKEVLGE